MELYWYIPHSLHFFLSHWDFFIWIMQLLPLLQMSLNCIVRFTHSCLMFHLHVFKNTVQIFSWAFVNTWKWIQFMYETVAIQLAVNSRDKITLVCSCDYSCIKLQAHENYHLWIQHWNLAMEIMKNDKWLTNDC